MNVRVSTQALTAERENLESTCDRLEDERESMMSEHEKIAVAHVKAVKTQEATFRSELMKQQHVASANLSQMKKKLFTSQKEKQKSLEKSERYKDKALKEHNVVRALKQDIQNLHSSIENERTRIMNENEHLKSRVIEIEKSRDTLLLGTEGGHRGGGGGGGGSLLDEKDQDQEDSNFNNSVDLSADTARREEVASYMNKLNGLMK